jgi:hypothetical protein
MLPQKPHAPRKNRGQVYQTVIYELSRCRKVPQCPFAGPDPEAVW